MKKYFIIIFILIESICNSQTLNKFISNGIEKEIIVLPSNFKLNKNFQLLGKVKSGNPTFKKNADYKTQLDKICNNADTIGGNILIISKFDNIKLTEHYNLKGNTYKIADFEKYKDSLFIKKLEPKSSNIILYRPNYTYSLNDLYNFTVIVNGKEYKMRRNSKQIISLENESNIEILIKETNEKINFDLKFGTNYYVRCVAYFSNYNGFATPNSISIPLGGYVPKIKIVNENGQGEIESALIELKE